MTIDELLRGEIALGYRLARRTRRDDAAARLVPLLDDRRVGLRARLSCLSPGQSVRARRGARGRRAGRGRRGPGAGRAPDRASGPAAGRGAAGRVERRDGLEQRRRSRRAGVLGPARRAGAAASAVGARTPECSPAGSRSVHGRGRRRSVGVSGRTGVRLRGSAGGREVTRSGSSRVFSRVVDRRHQPGRRATRASASRRPASPRARTPGTRSTRAPCRSRASPRTHRAWSQRYS